MAATARTGLSLYKQMMREANKFTDFNFRWELPNVGIWDVIFEILSILGATQFDASETASRSIKEFKERRLINNSNSPKKTSKSFRDR